MTQTEDNDQRVDIVAQALATNPNCAELTPDLRRELARCAVAALVKDGHLSSGGRVPAAEGPGLDRIEAEIAKLPDGEFFSDDEEDFLVSAIKQVRIGMTQRLQLERTE